MDLPLRHEVERLLSADGLAPPAGLLNDLLVDYLVASGFVRSQHLEDSMRRWRRDLFLPEAELRHVFSDRAVITADDGSGWVASSCSTPSITTSMIEALEVEPGHRILEIGSGTGYATALLSSLEEGIEVVALECLEETAHEARNRIRDLQIKNVRIVTGDGRGDLSAFGIFDRILISCGVEELPRGWSDLLRPGGLIVLPVGKFVHRLRRESTGLLGNPLFIADFVPCREDGEVLGTDWMRSSNDSASVWWPGRRLGEDGPEQYLEATPSAATMGPAMPGACVQSLLLLASLTESDRWFQFATPHSGWGFGLVEPGEGCALARFTGSFTFRHYRDHIEAPRFEVHGDGAPTDDFFALTERLDALSWPGPESFEVAIKPSEHAAVTDEFSVLRGEDAWVYRPHARRDGLVPA